MLKVITIVGARPQFIKAAAVSRAIDASFAGQVSEKIVHTGQHYDPGMSDVFFTELGIPQPAWNLEISGSSHGAMTGRMVEGIEKILLEDPPDWVLIYGDTNSTLAGALAAVKLHIPVAHVEAGLRSFNMRMPEEVNRILSDRVSDLLFCPTDVAVENLRKEGITQGVQQVGDVMYDVALHYVRKAREQSSVLARLGLKQGGFVLATCHRAENTDDPRRLAEICRGLAAIAEQAPVVLPIHPRTRKVLAQQNLESALGKVTLTDPIPYLDMVALEQAACAIVTDSGGVQKEAFFFDVPCITFRDETEWVETLNGGWNQLVGADATAIIQAFTRIHEPRPPRASVFGQGDTATAIVRSLLAQ